MLNEFDRALNSWAHWTNGQCGHDPCANRSCPDLPMLLVNTK